MGAKTLIVIAVGIATILNSCSAQFLAYQTDGLTSHNNYRKSHGSPAMSLDKALNQAAVDCALAYAKNRKIDHSCKTEGAGENLYAESSSDPKYNPDLQAVVKRGVTAWYNEKATYNFENPGSSTGVTGHFTQVVWKASTTLGIGAATVNGYTVVVGKYKPQGNVGFGNPGADFWQFYKENVKRTA